MNAGMFFASPIESSILSTASFAPPCAGPQRLATPAEMHAKGLAPVEPARRTVDVDAFCSWSACRMRIRSIARVRTRLGFHSSHGVPKVMYRKFSTYDRSLRGYMNGWPTLYL